MMQCLKKISLLTVLAATAFGDAVLAMDNKDDPSSHVSRPGPSVTVSPAANGVQLEQQVGNQSPAPAKKLLTEESKDDGKAKPTQSQGTRRTLPPETQEKIKALPQNVKASIPSAYKPRPTSTDFLVTLLHNAEVELARGVLRAYNKSVGKEGWKIEGLEDKQITDDETLMAQMFDDIRAGRLS